MARWRLLVAWCTCVAFGLWFGFGTLGAGRGLDAPPAPIELSEAEQSVTAKELRAALEYLASDALAGRGVGHAGNDAAVRFIASKLADSGIAPAAPGFLQPVPLVTSALGSGTRLWLVTSPGAAPDMEWKAGDDFFPVSPSASDDVEAPLVYVGRGIVDEDARVDDFAGVDVKDRIVVALDLGQRRRRASPLNPNSGRPRLVPDPGLVETKARHAASRGARGLIVVSREQRLRGFEAAWPDAPSLREQTFRLADDVLPIPVVRVGADVGRHLLGLGAADSPARDVGSLFNNPDHRFESPARVRLAVVIDSKAVDAPNVLGFVEGRDPTLKSDVVVVSAHLDHDGIDASGRIFNGADDDGSGTVAVMEIAGAFAIAARQGHTSRRSVLLALFNAEERGLLGSRHFASHPLPSGHQPVANINLDMIGRHEDIPRASDPRFRGLPPRSPAESRSLFHILGYSLSPDLSAVVKEEAKRLGLSAREDYDSSESNLLRRSDHWSFLSIGVPALFLTTGLHPDYHTPLDDVSRIDFRNLERMARLTFRAAWRIAEGVSEPRLVATPASEP